MMKKLLGIVVLGLLLSGNAYADIWQGLKDINKFNLDLNVSISEAGKIAILKLMILKEI